LRGLGLRRHWVRGDGREGDARAGRWHRKVLLPLVSLPLFSDRMMAPATVRSTAPWFATSRGSLAPAFGVGIGEVRGVDDGDGPGTVVAEVMRSPHCWRRRRRSQPFGRLEAVRRDRRDRHRGSRFAGAGDGDAGPRVDPLLDDAVVIGCGVIGIGIDDRLAGGACARGDGRQAGGQGGVVTCAAHGGDVHEPS